jgi:hypothetical protein
MIKNIFKILGAGILPVILFTACTKKPDVENTVAVKMAGEWFVEYFEDANPTVPLDHHSILLTYNTSDPNSGQIWVDDENFWPFKSKVNVDFGGMSFNATDNAANAAVAGESVKIFEGKVLPKAGFSKTGNQVDSIYLRVEFSDDPGNIYQIRGHLRTGFFEDEY